MNELQQLDGKIDEVLQRITTIEAVVQRQGELCPHRELLARAANNIERMGVMEVAVTDLRLDVAKIGVKAGALAGMIGGISTALIAKALGL